jgi:hypothetical protein
MNWCQLQVIGIYEILLQYLERSMTIGEDSLKLVALHAR